MSIRYYSTIVVCRQLLLLLLLTLSVERKTPRDVHNNINVQQLMRAPASASLPTSLGHRLPSLWLCTGVSVSVLIVCVRARKQVICSRIICSEMSVKMHARNYGIFATKLNNKQYVLIKH